MALAANPLLQPLQVGDMHLEHRVVMAPLTRCRALNSIPQPAAATYYSQRATKGVRTQPRLWLVAQVLQFVSVNERVSRYLCFGLRLEVWHEQGLIISEATVMCPQGYG